MLPGNINYHPTINGCTLLCNSISILFTYFVILLLIFISYFFSGKVNKEVKKLMSWTLLIDIFRGSFIDIFLIIMIQIGFVF